jgi:selenocysteine lyase/cysteine desulfurase
VSHSLNILAQGLNWKRGDEIILNNVEFPSNIYPFLNLEKKGVKIKYAAAVNGIVDIGQIEQLITPNTKLISISMVQFLSGYRANLKVIGDICEQNNIIFCVDGIQGVGAININVIECKIDFFTGGTHKWLMALQGLGYFYISTKLFQLIENEHVGWTSVKNPWNLLEYDIDLLDNAEKFQLGTLPRIALVALNSSLSLMELVGHDNIQNGILDNSEYLISRLSEIGIDPILKNVDRKNISGIVTFPIENGEKVLEIIKSKNIECTLREGLLRVSPHFYNTKNELDCLITELKNILS